MSLGSEFSKSFSNLPSNFYKFTSELCGGLDEEDFFTIE